MGKTFYSSPVSPNCRSVLMAMKAGQIDGFEIKDMDMQSGEHKSDWYLKINPNGAVPTLDDEGFILWESRAILTYMVNKYSKDKSLYPTDPQARAIVDRFLYFDSGTLQSKIMKFAVPIYFAKQEPNAEDKSAVEVALKTLDGFLAGKNYLTGAAPTIADFCCLASVSTLEGVDMDYSATPNVKAWRERAQTLPYYEECNSAAVAMLKQMTGKE